MNSPVGRTSNSMIVRIYNIKDSFYYRHVFKTNWFCHVIKYHRYFISINSFFSTSTNLQQALKLFENALNIYQHAFSSQHPNVLEVKADIERVSSQLK